MSFSHETQRKINQFTKEQALRYLELAEMTYLEKLRSKTSQTKQMIGKKLAKFKRSSDQTVEAQNDMMLYMSDYMNDLMSQGLSEQEAFEKAREQLSASSDSGPNVDLSDRFRKYVEQVDPAAMEAVGLFYGGTLFIGMTIGALIGFITSGGVSAFLQNGWIYTLVGFAAGIFLGIGVGVIGHAVIVTKMRRR